MTATLPAHRGPFLSTSAVDDPPKAESALAPLRLSGQLRATRKEVPADSPTPRPPSPPSPALPSRASISISGTYSRFARFPFAPCSPRIPAAGPSHRSTPLFHSSDVASVTARRSIFGAPLFHLLPALCNTTLAQPSTDIATQCIRCIDLRAAPLDDDSTCQHDAPNITTASLPDAC